MDQMEVIRYVVFFACIWEEPVLSKREVGSSNGTIATSEAYQCSCLVHEEVPTAVTKTSYVCCLVRSVYCPLTVFIHAPCGLFCPFAKVQFHSSSNRTNKRKTHFQLLSGVAFCILTHFS